MASSSSNKACVYCKDSSSPLRNGWQFRPGKYSLLCHRCCSAFEAGRFCETFHTNDDGWRNCASCGKGIHCGCLGSINQYLLLDDDGVICMECSKIKSLLGRNTESAPTDVTDLPTGAKMAPNDRPHSADLETQGISMESAVIPLFEKRLTTTDADTKFGRIVIPKRHAEAYFPKVSDSQGVGVALSILDNEGKERDICLRHWPTSSKYVLDGLRDFMIFNNLHARDTVTFARMESNGKIVIGFKKTSTEKGSN